MGQTYIDLYLHKEITLFVILFAIASLLVVPRQILGAWTRWRLSRNKLFMKYPMVKAKGGVTLFMPIYLEEHDVLRESLSKILASLKKWTDKYAIICIVDAVDMFPDEGVELAKIAKEYDAHVFMSNARSKRKNLRNAIRWAKNPEEKNEVLESAVDWAEDNSLLYEFSFFNDSDTIPVTPDDNIVGELLRPFAELTIGGVTTAQRIRNPDTWLVKILDWLENSRLGSSMAAGTLFGQVVCLPGRLYAVRSKLIVGWCDELVDDFWTVPKFSLKWPFVSSQQVQAHAGDDRRTTMRIQELGYKTVMNPSAAIVTLMPDSLFLINKIFRRWGTSSQWLTIFATFKCSWFRKLWFAMYLGWGDILVTLITVFLVLRWAYLMALNLFGFGDENLLIPSMILLLYSVGGILLTFTTRQVWHLAQNPRRILLLPVFIVLVTWWQFVRLLALLTPQQIGTWGSRKGVDDKKGEVWFYSFEEYMSMDSSIHFRKG
jgi:cellulose synthase/poly-beta-1,6-N-acetylglucosamine synthase-like glycosyltransferase